MKKIDGTPKTIRELFTGVKYTVHYSSENING
jgi:hypothetical protein